MYKMTDKSNGFNVDIDLRHELNSLTSEFSIRVLYVRNCKFVKCDCYDEFNKNGNPNCPKCFGTGYFASIESIDAIQSSVGGYSGADKLTPTPVGTVSQKEEVYYVDYTVLPKERDYILKVTWKNNLPVDIVSVKEIINIFEMRGDHGRSEVFGANIQDRPDLLKTFDKTLKAFPIKALKYLSKGGKYIWPYKLLS